MSITITGPIAGTDGNDPCTSLTSREHTFLAVVGTADAETLALLADGIASLVTDGRPVVVAVDRLIHPATPSPVPVLLRLLRERSPGSVVEAWEGAIRLASPVGARSAPD